MVFIQCDTWFSSQTIHTPVAMQGVSVLLSDQWPVRWWELLKQDWKNSAGRWHLAGLKKQLLSVLSVSAVWEEIRRTLHFFPEQNQNPQQHRSSDLGPDFKLFNSECLGVFEEILHYI